MGEWYCSRRIIRPVVICAVMKFDIKLIILDIQLHLLCQIYRLTAAHINGMENRRISSGLL